MRRYIESALRIKWRLLLSALLVFGLAMAGLSFTKGGFTSSANVWVEKPLYSQQDPSADLSSRYMTAAQLQAQVLNELLSTRSFTLGIAEAVGIPMNTASQQAAAISDIQQKLTVEATGPHTIWLSYTGAKPDYCQAIISQTISAFITTVDAGRMKQAEFTLKQLKEQQEAATKQMSRSKSDLDKYLRDNPGTLLPGAPTDPTYDTLLQQYYEDRTRHTEITDEISQVSTQSSTSSEFMAQFFRVIDEPTEAETYKTTTKDILRNVFLSLVMGVITMVGLTLVGTWTDKAIYTLNDVSTLAIADETGNSRELLVGVLPYVRSLGAMRRQTTKQLRRRRSTPSVIVEPVSPAPGSAASSGSVPRLNPPIDSPGVRG